MHAAAERGDRLVVAPLANLPTRPAGESVVGLLVLSSRGAIPANELEAALPATVELDSAGDPGPALARLAGRLSADLGCSVETRAPTLALR